MADDDPIKVEFPGASHGPLRHIALRIAFAVGLVTFVALLTYIGRSGYVDPEDDSVSLLDAFYYSTVSITTTGYGDIRPVTDETRLATTLLVTPARILFLILLVGTTVEILAQRSRDAYRRARWKRTLNDHIIICGYGVKGRGAVKTLRANGVKPSEIVVIEPQADARARATAQGITAIAGDAASTEALIEAGVRRRALDHRRRRPRRHRRARDAHRARAQRHRADRRRPSARRRTSTSCARAARPRSSRRPKPPAACSASPSSSRSSRRSSRTSSPSARASTSPSGPSPTTSAARSSSSRCPARSSASSAAKELLRFNDPRAGVLKPGDRVIYLVSQRR